MAKKPVFDMRCAGGTIVPTPYDPLVYMRGGMVWRFALHREKGLKGTEWVVSDPVSGKALCRVKTTYKGLPMTTRDLPLNRAREVALIDLDSLVDRVGFDRFIGVLGEAQKTKG